MQRKRWKDLPPARRAQIVSMSVIELGLLTWALLDLRRRPATAIRGNKLAWVALAFVQPVGPLAYLLFGRKR